MLIYRVKYTEPESDIRNYNFFYKNTKQANIFSNILKLFEKSEIKFVFCIMYKLYNSYFVTFEIL